MATTETKIASSSYTAGLSWARVCKECGQQHDGQDSHLYEYQDDVDDELVCHICLQPLLKPMDTPCGHTYCFHCLSNFLKEQDFCPVDRQRLQLHQCRPSSLLVRNLLDKLTVTCPHYADCQQQMQRCELQPHLHNRCPVFRRLREEAEKRKRPSWNELKGRKGDNESSVDAKHSATQPRNPTRDQPEPGLINPAFEESEDGMESFYHPNSYQYNSDSAPSDFSFFFAATNTQSESQLPSKISDLQLHVGQTVALKLDNVCRSCPFEPKVSSLE